MKIVEWILYALIGIGLLMLLSCQPVEHKSLVMDGAIQCVAQGPQLFCRVHLEETVEEPEDE